LSDRIVLTMSLDPALDRGICGNTHKTLALIRSLAGHSCKLVTLTCSLARQLGRCTNTVRNHYRELEASGYLWWQPDQRTGLTTLYVREAVEPPSRRARLEAKRQAAADSLAELERRVVDRILEGARKAAGAVSALGGPLAAAAEGPATGAPRPATWPVWPRPSQAWRCPQGGAQIAAPIKASKEERGAVNGSGWLAQAPIRTIAEQIAFCLAHATG
jgi:hypothetical protein